jgi:hypothetical protein
MRMTIEELRSAIKNIGTSEFLNGYKDGEDMGVYKNPNAMCDEADITAALEVIMDDELDAIQAGSSIIHLAD